MRYPKHETTAPVGVLQEHLAAAEALAASRSEPEWTDTHVLREDFEALRWFELPEACLP